MGAHRYVYREKLLRMHRRLTQSARTNNANDIVFEAAKNANDAKLQVDLAHIGEYDASMLGYLLNQPAHILPALENAASDALKSLLYERKYPASADDLDKLDEDMLDATQETQELDPTENSVSEALLAGVRIQILLQGSLQPTPLRSIQSQHMNRLLKCPGIVISTSPVKNRATTLKVRCSRCLDSQTVYATEGPFGSLTLPTTCRGPSPHECGRFPYSVVPDESIFVDQQTLKLQEAPERVPTGEMPRSVLLAVERSNVDQAAPGTRVSVLCVPTLFTSGKDGTHKSVYLRVLGMTKDNDAHGEAVTYTPAEEEAFRTLSRRPDVYEILQRSIAPNISGSYTVDIKKALCCQLLGGSRKKLPDGVRLRGDINVLLLGDPSMAKSQFLKFISKVAPVGIYTSGKGSSAAGLTASVVRDAKGEFYLEGGAMVLADGGIVCIDEFDKMRPADRVAIHEAMEQQTISVAKAGITTVLNSRSSVLAAANPVFGRYDDFKSASENIDLMTTILSRFDVIFLVRDIREEERDRLICQHVMGIHIGASNRSDGGLGHVRGGGADDGGALSYMAGSSGISDPNEESVNRYVETKLSSSALCTSTSHKNFPWSKFLKRYPRSYRRKCSARGYHRRRRARCTSNEKIHSILQGSLLAASVGRSG